jgi:hypothetical protein
MTKNVTEKNEIVEKTLTKELKKSIDDLIHQKRMMARDKEAYNESLVAVADKIGVKSGVLSRRIDLILKEEEKGGEIKSKESDLEFVETYFMIKDNPQQTQ